MNRVLKIVIYAVVLFLVYLWIASVVKSYNKKSSTADLNNTTVEGESLTYDDEIYDEYFESDQDDTLTVDTENFEESVTDVSDYNSGDFSYEASEEEVKALQKGNDRDSAPAKKTATSNSGGPGYMVIAGSYLIRENANKMVSKLKEMGYSEAEIVTFDLSQYHSVSAGRYYSYDDAAIAARNIKNKGVDCYVHTRKD